MCARRISSNDESVCGASQMVISPRPSNCVATQRATDSMTVGCVISMLPVIWARVALVGRSDPVGFQHNSFACHDKSLLQPQGINGVTDELPYHVRGIIRRGTRKYCHLSVLA
jgi:hypothetical protein